VAKEVRRALAIERPKTRKRVVDRLSREEERKLIAHAYRVQGTRGLLIKTLLQTGARVSEFVNIKTQIPPDLVVKSQAADMAEVI
jgi:integrase/recombinase XerD